MICDVCGEKIEEWEFEEGYAFKYEGGAIHERCREEYFGTPED